MVKFIGSNKEFKANVKRISSNKIFNHHIIRKKTTATQSFQLFINKLLQDAVGIVNFIKSKTLIFIIFTIICNKM